VIKKISQAENHLNLGLKEKNQNQKIQDMEEKHLLAIDLKEEMVFGNREDRAPSFKSRSNSKEGFAEKGKSDFF